MSLKITDLRLQLYLPGAIEWITSHVCVPICGACCLHYKVWCYFIDTLVNLWLLLLKASASSDNKMITFSLIYLKRRRRRKKKRKRDDDELWWWWWWGCFWSCMQRQNIENFCQILKFILHTSLVILPWLANYRSLIMNTLKKNDWSRFYVLWFKLWSDCMWRGPGLYYGWLTGALHQRKKPIIIPLLLVIFMIYALSLWP